MRFLPEPGFSDGEMRLVLSRLTKVKTALCTYDYLQRSLPACDVVASREYRTAFNGYYRMRQRPPHWYEVFFSILEREKRNGAISFGLVLDEVFDEILSNVVDRESGVIRQPPSGPPAQSGSVPPARHR